MKVCIVGVSGKLGRYMAQHALDRGYEVVGVCRERSVGKLDAFKGRITVVPGATNDREVIQQAVVLASAALGAMERRATPDEAADAMGILFARSMAALQGALRPSP